MKCSPLLPNPHPMRPRPGQVVGHRPAQLGRVEEMMQQGVRIRPVREPPMADHQQITRSTSGSRARLSC
eukprot:1609828-Prymnesium_polylepis.1